MKIIIAGSGIAGKSCASFLRRLPFVKSIKIVGESSSSVDLTINSLYTGLWGPSLSCFRELGLYESLKPHLHAVGTSGYKSTSGAWLAQPASDPPLAFIRNDHLHAVLDADLQRDDRVDIAHITNHYVTSISPSVDDKNLLAVGTSTFLASPTSLVPLTDMSGSGQFTTLDGHLVVAADGMNSTIRALWKQHLRNSHPSDSSTNKFMHADVLQYRGYKVYRGHSTARVNRDNRRNGESDGIVGSGGTGGSGGSGGDTRISTVAFQTWGPGKRFACVSTSTGNAWFAAVSEPHPNFRPATSFKSASADEQLHRIPSSNGTDVTLTSRRREGVLSGAFANQSRHVGEGEWWALKDQFRLWHAPVSALLDHTDSVVHVVPPQPAANTPPSSSPSSSPSSTPSTSPSPSATRVVVCDALVHSFCTHPAYRQQRLRQQRLMVDDVPAPRDPFTGVVFVGDAAHTLDPILAQVSWGVPLSPPATRVRLSPPATHLLLSPPVH